MRNSMQQRAVILCATGNIACANDLIYSPTFKKLIFNKTKKKTGKK